MQAETAVAEQPAKVAPDKRAERPVSPLNGQPVPVGRRKGVPNTVTRTIKEAIEFACKPGACHPQGLAGWLIERATGGVEDRKIFAGLVGKVIPAQLQANIDGNIVVQLPWLTARNVGRRGSVTSHSSATDAQVIDVTMEKDGNLRVGDPKPALEAPTPTVQTPHPPIDRQAGGGVE